MIAQEILLFGLGGHGRVVFDVANACGIRFTRFVDDAPVEENFAGAPVNIASLLNFADLGPFSFLIAIGRNGMRREKFLFLSKYGTPITLVHPFTCISREVDVGRGVVIMPGVVVNTGSKIGDDVILNTSCSVDHDCVIGPHSHICPGVNIAGSVTVGAGTMIGTGAAVIPGIRIGENCTIGAGAVVTRDIPAGSVAYGSPCRVQPASAVPKA